MDSVALGKTYRNQEIILAQREAGTSIYVIQDGLVGIEKEIDGKVVQLAVRCQGDMCGVITTFEKDVRMATVRAVGEARVLAIDNKNFLRCVGEDPSLVFRLAQAMSARLLELSFEILHLR
jgi:CRP-like cAMP-binding protein